MKTLISFLIILTNSSAHAESLNDLLQQAYEANPALLAEMHAYHAEDSLKTSQSWLDDPIIGMNKLDRGNETTYGMVSQKIRFPVKYYYQNRAQSSRALAQKAKSLAKKFQVRKKVISTYYSIFALQKVILLTKANMQAVRDFSRVAERKYAAGKAPQSDSMKAHFELTGLELELMRFKQEEETLQAELRALVNNQYRPRLSLEKIELEAPATELKQLDVSLEQLEKVLKKKSPRLKAQIHKLGEAQEKSALAKWEFAPDLNIQYQQRMSGSPEDSEILTVGLQIPLWFWTKGAKASAASARETAEEYRLKSESDQLLTDIKDLRGKVEVGEKTLKIYKTSLIPQAQGAFNSSKGAYRANKTSFLDLLDSERSLFKVKTGYYQSLKHYVRHLVSLEAELGFTVSEDIYSGGSK